MEDNILDIVGRDVDDGENEQGVRHLTMKPNRLVERQPSEPWSQPFEKIPAHGQENQSRIEGQHQPGAPGEPDRVFQDIQLGQLSVRRLYVPILLTFPGTNSMGRTYHPPAKTPIWAPQKMI